MSLFSAPTKSTTPSSILKKTPSLKSTLNRSLKVNTPTKVRFILPHSKKVRHILKDYIKHGNAKDYENLVCLIRDAELFDDDISSLLKEATECISIMKQELRLFVEALLSVDWIERNENVVKEYQSFIANLVAAHNYHADFVINKLVTLFFPPLTDPEWENGTPSKTDILKCQHVHSLLCELLRTVPLCNELLIHALIDHFPYMNKSTHIHEYYIQNLLWVICYQPTLRPNILHLIFSKLIIMDVSAPREEIAKLEEEEIFMMDESKTNTTINLDCVHSMAHTLDVCLDKVFNYIYSECHEPGTNDLNWGKTKSLYQDILTVFDQSILPTYNTHHVQFVMFVLCSFKTTLTEAFFNYLWKKVCNPNVASVIRQAAVNYIVSFIARATFVPLTMLKGTLQQMAEWIHSYIATQDGLECVNSDLRLHSVFYTVCQALFYVISFRHKDLVNTKKNVVFLESLNLAKIVTSRLNPLRVCQPAVVQNFAAITRKYQLAYCYSIIEHNSRNTLPTVYRDEKGFVTVSSNVLEACYPFDPFVLSRSSAKVHPFYRDYKEVSFEVNDSEMREIGDVDDFLENDFNSKTQKFSYGTSPGFKFKG
ncbi:RNA polymerase I-specific transcription initiation factor RRN3 [Tribolium castaneum]|uniref:RNA polymerase I-specific transcription initiation factor RRN3-like Protein n=1 Tax=Tribolium castaneum TaxID=7070 RepID=D6X392_TRICA|nr:PREDICTED: RNA polymerase I-specific transcription initiation factor RRN3 [Tribolium castaneum]EFA10824.2 RNA polymerase I-specific transcription initiation factor RRN3-like Protein [Tribolium castaneum]|eukprot:XP_972768.1 PREDICTED: RNA polymerase I-specific transcription initiation factor RRN3 [Tribolium castaneum]